jgi:hypothetical protein
MRAEAAKPFDFEIQRLAVEANLTAEQREAVRQFYKRELDRMLNIGIELACCDCPDEIRETLASDNHLENTRHD